MTDQILEILTDIEGRYPADIFPVDGKSLECAGARFVRGVLQEIRNRIGQIEEDINTIPEVTPTELAQKVGLPTRRIWDRLHHRRCPKTRRYLGETGRLIRVEVTNELVKFLSQPTARQLT